MSSICTRKDWVSRKGERVGGAHVSLSLTKACLIRTYILDQDFLLLQFRGPGLRAAAAAWRVHVVLRWALELLVSAKFSEFQERNNNDVLRKHRLRYIAVFTQSEVARWMLARQLFLTFVLANLRSWASTTKCIFSGFVVKQVCECATNSERVCFNVVRTVSHSNTLWCPSRILVVAPDSDAFKIRKQQIFEEYDVKSATSQLQLHRLAQCVMKDVSTVRCWRPWVYLFLALAL